MKFLTLILIFIFSGSMLFAQSDQPEKYYTQKKVNPDPKEESTKKADPRNMTKQFSDPEKSNSSIIDVTKVQTIDVTQLTNGGKVGKDRTIPRFDVENKNSGAKVIDGNSKKDPIEEKLGAPVSSDKNSFSFDFKNFVGGTKQQTAIQMIQAKMRQMKIKQSDPKLKGEEGNSVSNKERFDPLKDYIKDNAKKETSEKKK